MNLFKSIFGAAETESTTPKVDWRPLKDVGQLNEIIQESTEKAVAIFKHSTRCSISRMALKQFENEFDLDGLVTPYFVDLLEDRNVSNEVTKRFGIEHQSPQLLLIKNGESVYAASHGDINADDLKRYL